jgi:hypothetical protein
MRASLARPKDRIVMHDIKSIRDNPQLSTPP